MHFKQTTNKMLTLKVGGAGYLSGIALGYGLDDRWFESRQGLGIFLFTTASRPALGPSHGNKGLFPWW
jgi:hypothetical protein